MLMQWLADPHVWASFITLSALEIVLGVDNLVFIALLAGRLPPEQRGKGRKLGLALALGTRLGLLGSIAWLAHLTEPVVSLGGRDFSWRDLILLAGGAFLLFKGTREIHLRVDEDEHSEEVGRKTAGLVGTIIQIVLLDVVFSLDSVITAVGIAESIWVMVAAIVVAMVVMLVASDALALFIERHTSVKMLALSFLLLIGMMLVADGFGFHVPHGYVFAAMGFSVLVESLNLLVLHRRRTKKGKAKQSMRSGLLPARKMQ
jgi:predicted tellurium resistance membrane protein TerC